MWQTAATDSVASLIEAAIYAETARIDLGQTMYGPQYPHSFRHQAHTGRNGGGALRPSILPARTKIADFPFGHIPEGFSSIPRPTRFREMCNVQRKIVVVPMASVGKSMAAWPMKKSGAHFPMARDEDAQRILVHFGPPKACRDSPNRVERVVASLARAAMDDDLL